jgi:two-component system cell cycle sensor histidine kinase/response regulator CckA
LDALPAASRLTIIRGNGDLLADRVGADAFLAKCTAQIQKASSRAVSMTRQLLAFSRMQVLQPRVLDLNTVIAEMGKMLPRLIGEHIEQVFVPATDLKRVTADPGQIEQVLMNLAVNARDAMPSGGKLTIHTANVTMNEDEAVKHASMVPGKYVLISVTDTGHGMNDETKRHIFEPFFTTKEIGKGTGLGLATVYGIVKQSGGFIWVESAVGIGTTFEIYLPQTPERASKPETEADGKPEFHRGSETILLVEDESGVRELAAEFLKVHGYTVIEAGNGVEALEVAARYEGPIHVLLTDMIMPKMGGAELRKRIAASRPDLRIAFMTGYSEYATPESDASSKSSRVLQKPFSSASISQIVRDTLAGSVGEASGVSEVRVS